MTAIAGSFNFIQQESVQFNNPASESSVGAIGSSVNGLLVVLNPVGTILPSMLTEVQFQAQLGNPIPATFVLADGRSVAGSSYQSITSQANIPDLRGISIRGKNGSRSDGNQNPDGDLSLGTFTANRFGSHNHNGNTGSESANHTHALPAGLGGNTQFVSSGPDVNVWRVGATANTEIESAVHVHAIASNGGNDTAPSNVTINYFIRIN